MLELHDILVAWIAGCASGFIASFIPGPITVAIINEGARRGFLWAFLIGLGSATMETVYCAIGFASFSTVFDIRWVKAMLELVSFLLILALGIKYLRARTVEEHNPRADRIEQRLHPHSAFLIGFVQVLGNMGVLLMWIALAAVFVAHEWVHPNWNGKVSCIVGVYLGALAWFVLLAWAVSRRQKKFSPQTLLRMEHASGLLLLGVAVAVGVRIISILSKP